VSSGSGTVEIEVHLRTEKFEEDDERWANQQTELITEIRREVGTVTVRRENSPGHKGALETIILALGPAGAFQAATTCFQAWLARDRTRRIELSWTRNGVTESFTLEGKDINDETFSRLEAKLQQLRIEP
jgi:hypothetical protein